MTTGKKLKVLMVVNGFPTEDSPTRGIFNLRAVRGLKSLVDIKVIQFRVWRPGRKFVDFAPIEGVDRRILAYPSTGTYGGGMLRSLVENIEFIETRYFGGRSARDWIEECDIIHSVGVSYSGIVAGHWAKKYKRHHVTQAIGSDVHTELKVMKDWFTVRGWEQCVQGVSCNSQALVNDFLSIYPKIPNVKAIFRGVDVQHFRPDGDRWGPFSELSDHLEFVFVGGMPNYGGLYGTNMKGGETLMDAWKSAEASEVMGSTRLYFAGPDANIERVQQWRDSLQFPDRVIIGDTVDPKQMPQLLRTANVVLVPSMEEGTPNVALESAASGVAVIGSTAGGTPEVVAHNETGMIFPRGEANSLRELLISAATDPQRVTTMGKAARVRMETIFNKDLFAPRILELYRAALQIPLPEER